MIRVEPKPIRCWTIILNIIKSRLARTGNYPWIYTFTETCIVTNKVVYAQNIHYRNWSKIRCQNLASRFFQVKFAVNRLVVRWIVLRYQEEVSTHVTYECENTNCQETALWKPYFCDNDFQTPVLLFDKVWIRLPLTWHDIESWVLVRDIWVHEERVKQRTTVYYDGNYIGT